MKTALLFNGSKKYGGDNGELNALLQEIAKNQLISQGYQILETVIANGYEANQEIQKILQADVLIWQMPMWWMGEPWFVKKYFDEVLKNAGGILFAGDGRTDKNQDLKYGTGGLCSNKLVMISITCNAPIGAFNNSQGFFEGIGIEKLYLHFYKIHQFLGIKKLPPFLCSDVIKNPQIEKYIKDYQAHLKKYL